MLLKQKGRITPTAPDLLISRRIREVVLLLWGVLCRNTAANPQAGEFFRYAASTVAQGEI
jgi:hypothetical protein